jgi:serine/threonine protein kinase
MAAANLSATMHSIANYDLLDKIAEGGMGTVYRGRNRLTGATVAVKVVPPHLLTNPVVLRRFEQEYNVARAIDHPNIVKALDFGREGDARFLVMEFVEGESLGQKIERDGAMPEADAIRIITQVAEGLQSAHAQGVIHRDVKPDNVLITADGVAKLTDLGLVKELDADLNLTRTGRGLGTPHFMAPEQFRNAKKADVRCDIYSLGATLYMMVTGELPFKSNGPLDAWMKKINNEIDTPRQRRPALSERVDWAIRRAMSPDPTHRPACCREFIEDLSGQSTQETVITEPGIGAASSIWYLVYMDEAGEVHTVKGTIKGIRRSFNEGLLGDAENIRVARIKEGPYEALRHYAEFRDLVVQPAVTPLPPTRPPQPVDVAPQPAPPKPREHVGPPSMSESHILQTTTIAIPTINDKQTPEHDSVFKLLGAALDADMKKWIVFGIVFIGTSLALSYFYQPISRYLRYWLGLMD